MKIKIILAVANNIDANLFTVNNFFANWLKEIDIKRYGDVLQILPIINFRDIYRYSDAIVKHIPKDALRPINQSHCLLIKTEAKKILTTLITGWNKAQ